MLNAAIDSLPPDQTTFSLVRVGLSSSTSSPSQQQQEFLSKTKFILLENKITTNFGFKLNHQDFRMNSLMRTNHSPEDFSFPPQTSWELDCNGFDSRLIPGLKDALLSNVVADAIVDIARCPP